MNRTKLFYSASTGFALVAAFLLIHNLKPIDHSTHFSGKPSGDTPLQFDRIPE